MKASHEEGSVTLRAFARILGERSPGYVSQLKGEGRLVLTADGRRVRVQESLALIRSSADPSKAAVVARHAATRGKGHGSGEIASSAAAASARDGGEDAGDLESEQASGFAYWRERTEKAKALAAERENLVADGKLLDAERVEAAVAQAGATVRTALEALPYDLAPELAPITDEGQIKARLVEAIEAALSELSRQFGAIAKAVAA